MKQKCMTCGHRNKYFPNGCSVDYADPESAGNDCQYYKEDMRTCPKCRRDVPRSNMILVKDCYGIPYKHVCPKCVKATKAELQPYPYEEAIDDY